MMPPAIVQVSLDGSYSKAERAPRVFAYGGLFGYEAAWKTLVPQWLKNLPPGRAYYRSSELAGSQSFEEVRDRLVDVCVNVGLTGFGSAAVAELLSEKSEARKKRDIFMHVVKDLLRVVPPGVNVALVCDREQDLAKQVDAWLQRERDMARRDGVDSLDERITGICYMNSRMSVQTQAADLMVGLLREHAERREADPFAPIDPRLDRLGGGRMKDDRLVRSEFVAEIDDPEDER